MSTVAVGLVGKAAAVLACATALTLGVAPPVARADEPADVPDDRDGRALAGAMAGALTALGPLVVGGALWAHDSRPDLQRDGTYVMLAGFAAAPWVSHAIAGRWRRALVFGLASLGASAGTLVAMRAQDPFDPSIANHDRLTFGFLLTTAFFAAAVGVVDSFIVGPTPRETR